MPACQSSRAGDTPAPGSAFYADQIKLSGIIHSDTSTSMDTETPDSPPTGQTEYRVVPFVAKIPENAGPGVAAGQLQEMIQYWAQSGWQYVCLETVETHIAGSAGCFGLGATPPKITAFSMVVFKR